MKIVLTHAYSATNSGDGLLVREAMNLVRVSVPSAEIHVLALDPVSFADLEASSVVHPIGGAGRSPHLLRLGLQLVRNAASGSLLHPAARRMLANADLIVAVGGGYLRAKTALDVLKLAIAHVPQLPRRSNSVQAIYLSQSIGPFAFGTGAFINARLARAEKVFVRDDRSRGALGRLGNVERVADTAVLPLGEAGAIAARASGRDVTLVARALGTGLRTAAYEARLVELRRLTSATVVTQATGRGNDDRAFYQKMGFGSTGSLRSSLQKAEDMGVVVSVRLHGAIEALRAGVPAIHLSYERKGWGAFEDLGISTYVHNAFDFDVDTVVDQVERIAWDPEAYWDAVGGASARLGAQAASLKASLSKAAQRARVHR